ncbi:MAG: zinc-ribbon domain containing protein [Planctomycetota bacterium]
MPKQGKNRSRKLQAQKLKLENRVSAKRSRSAIDADRSQLVHNNTYDSLPEYYVDLDFRCVDCGVQEVWTAAQQKWWYETVKANINSKAVRCSRCRKQRRDEREVQRSHMRKMAARQAGAVC